jgi:hypothetical protein
MINQPMEPRNMKRSPELLVAITERDRILADMDIEAAKGYIVKHGGTLPKRPLDWERVLHLARFEVTTMPPDLRTASHVYLIRTGVQPLGISAHAGPYVKAALNLIFPKAMTDAYIRQADAMQAERQRDEVYERETMPPLIPGIQPPTKIIVLGEGTGR